MAEGIKLYNEPGDLNLDIDIIGVSVERKCGVASGAESE